MARAIILVLDSLGIGYTPDAVTFGDKGANTLGHIAQWCAEGNTSEFWPVGRQMHLPNLAQLGLGKAAELVSGTLPKGLETSTVIGSYAACEEISKGKDTPSGHWEMAGVPVLFDWGYFPKSYPSFPQQLTDRLIQEANLPGILGNKHASGTTIIAELGDEHIETGQPIFYTSADSVLQIAAHEEHFGLDRLYDLCYKARQAVDDLDLNIGRIIARPFLGDSSANYARTGNRKDIATPPHEPTLLDHLTEAGRSVIAVGKISDIYAGSGISKSIKASGHDALFEQTLRAMDTAQDGDLIFTNFVEFDQSFGHRRNPGGYADCLEHFDRRIVEVTTKMAEDDLLILTADHGCDTTWEGSDHTREHVPFLAYRPNLPAENMGVRKSFADIGQTVASYLNVKPVGHGTKAL
ncbi:phosphopentomutase [Temperatibacter marinus]|uniref:Phosphopentomutase n=1 Tax=Temperatibacter marinus TaxID=1456591 RepID=A0AA52HA20_9PROT|nr:phosphopentomutase [Temperatibacter marinus]WND03157.1 phosphopentomutase [Temperatibacter marinus]